MTLSCNSQQPIDTEKAKMETTQNNCSPNIEHWHGVVWLKPVTDDEYNAGA